MQLHCSTNSKPADQWNCLEGVPATLLFPPIWENDMLYGYTYNGKVLNDSRILCAISVQGTEPPNAEKPGWWDPPGGHRIKTHIHRDSRQCFPAPTWLEGRHSGDCGLWVTHLPADGGYYLLLDMFLDMYFLDREINKKKMTINTIIYWILRMCQDYA